MLEQEHEYMKKINSHDTTEDSSKKQNESPGTTACEKSKEEKRRNKKKIQAQNCNNGRWSQEEHKRFIEAMFLYGNEWKKVQQHINTRSSTQARSHAQKFFISVKKKLFSDEEFSTLRNHLTSPDQPIQYDKISKLFRECVPNNEFLSVDKEKLLKFMINLNSIEKNIKRKDRRNKNKKIEKEESELKTEISKKKKNIFFIEKQAELKKQKSTTSEYNEIQLSVNSDQNCSDSYDNFMKLKRNLQVKKPNRKSNTKKEFNENNLSKFPQKDLYNSYLLQNQNYLPKFDDFKYINNISQSPRNLKSFNHNMWLNEVEIGNNNIFNDIDFLNVSIVDKSKNYISFVNENDNFDN
jgi:SHAQKYF class myb-like DNA-binding protein